jgi:anti-anti-sigma factor
VTTEDSPVVTIEHGPLTIRSSRQDDEHVVALYGELDLGGVDAVKDEMRRVERTAADRIVVDLSALEFMDSSGLRSRP